MRCGQICGPDRVGPDPNPTLKKKTESGHNFFFVKKTLAVERLQKRYERRKIISCLLKVSILSGAVFFYTFSFFSTEIQLTGYKFLEQS